MDCLFFLYLKLAFGEGLIRFLIAEVCLTKHLVLEHTEHLNQPLLILSWSLCWPKSVSQQLASIITWPQPRMCLHTMHYLTSVNSGHGHTLCVYPSMKCVNASFLIPLTFKVCLRFSLIMGPYHDVSVVSSAQQFPVCRWFFWSTLLIQPCCYKHFVMALHVSNAFPDTFCSKRFDTYFYMHNSKALIILLRKLYQYLALSF